MAIRGLRPLPVIVDNQDALKILGTLSTVSHKIGRLDEKFRHSIVSEALVQILSLSESVESTRIEGTQVAFSDYVTFAHSPTVTCFAILHAQMRWEKEWFPT